MLNPNAQKWVDALRSGRFKQTSSALAVITPDGYRHCCLGVACEVYLESGGLLMVARVTVYGPDGRLIPGLKYGRTTAFLPPAVQKWLGLRAVSGSMLHADGGSLTEMNDMGASFDQIADTIESEPEGLFQER